MEETVTAVVQVLLKGLLWLAVFLLILGVQVGMIYLYQTFFVTKKDTVSKKTSSQDDDQEVPNINVKVKSAQHNRTEKEAMTTSQQQGGKNTSITKTSKKKGSH